MKVINSRNNRSKQNQVATTFEPVDAQYQTASRKLANVGCARAQGDALRAMYAKLVCDMHGGKPEIYYAHLCRAKDVEQEAKTLLSDRLLAWNVLMGPREASTECSICRKARIGDGIESSCDRSK